MPRPSAIKTKGIKVVDDRGISSPRDSMMISAIEATIDMDRAFPHLRDVSIARTPSSESKQTKSTISSEQMMSQGSSSGQDSPSSVQSRPHGTSEFLLPNPAGLVAEAKFFHSKSCGCCASEAVEARTYARVYENRLEINRPFTFLQFCGCASCATEKCVQDNVSVYYFDKGPTTSSTAPFPFCFCTCSTLFGRPAVGVYTSKYCSSQFSGQSLFSAPCVAKSCICFGDRCFPFACTLASPLRNGQAFLSALKAAYTSYADKRNIPVQERARFWMATDAPTGLAISEVSKNLWNPKKARGLQEMEVMERA